MPPENQLITGLAVTTHGITTDNSATEHLSAKVHSEAFLAALMARQLRLSVTCAGAFLVGLLGLPLANYFLPEFMARRVWGFTLSWLVLGVGFFPAVWVIAWVFIRRSVLLEEKEAAGIEKHQ